MVYDVGATDFGDYDYTRSGNPTRDALQNLVAELEGLPGTKAYVFSTGMAAISAVTRVLCAGQEVIVNDDSYGGTYRLMSKIATRYGITVKYINMAGKEGPELLRQTLTARTRLVMIESPTNPMQRICDIKELANVCHSNPHPIQTLLSIDNTMMSPIFCRPLQLGADIVIHSATKFMAGHADTMAGVVAVRDMMLSPEKDGDEPKSLAQTIYFHQNAEGTGLAPFDCWLVLRGIRTMHIRILQQQNNAFTVASFLKTHPKIASVIYCGFPDHVDYDIHQQQASGYGCVVCFTTGSFELSKHIVTVTKLFKITVSFGSVSSVISVPGQMSHASIPPEVRSVRDFPEDLVRMSIGIESPNDLIADLQQAIDSFQS
jgi:cysteine-S-conjugate beta-lyase